MALDRLEAMRAFCRIVEVGSFSGAAESLGLAKTTISGQVQALEQLLGIKLLHRTTRKVSPTTEGTAYYSRARALIDEVDELEASVSKSRNIVRGRIRVEMPSPVGILLIVPALPDFAARFPDIHLDIGCSERVTDLVRTRSVTRSLQPISRWISGNLAAKSGSAGTISRMPTGEGISTRIRPRTMLRLLETDASSSSTSSISARARL